MQQQNDYRFVLEHIQEGFLGEEVSADTPFTDYAIAKVQRYGGRIDYVAVKWDESIFGARIIFDPNCTKGAIEKIIYTYIYGRVAYKTAIPEEVPTEVKNPDFTQIDVKKMNHEAMRAELSLLHGLSDDEIRQYKNPITRRAKVVEMRAKLNEQQ